MAGVQAVLHNQSKAAYNITEEELMAGVDATVVCTQLLAFVRAHVAEANRRLDRYNAARFTAELADRFVDALVAHVKRLTITQSGGLLLMQDMTRYRDLVLVAGASTKRAELLTEVAKIFIVDASQEQAILRETSLHTLDPAEYRALVAARADSRAKASLLTKLAGKVKSAAQS